MTPTRFAPLGGSLAALIVGLAGAAAAQAPQRDSLTLYEFPDYRGASVTFYADNPNIGSTGFTNRARSAQVIGTWRVCSGGGYRNRCEVLNHNVRDLSAYGLENQVGSAQRLSSQAYAQPAPAPPYEPPRYGAPRPEAPRSAPLQPAQPGPSEPAAPPPSPQPGPYYGAPAQPGYGDRPYPPPSPAYPGDEDYRGYAAPPPEAYGPPGYAPPPAGYAPQEPYGGSVGYSATFFARPTVRGMDLSATGPAAADTFCRSQRLRRAVYFDARQRAGRSIAPDGRVVGPGPVLRDVLCRRY